MPPTGPSKPSILDNPVIPLGPRAQQQKQQRPSSKQWINPNLKKAPESPKVTRAQTFSQQQQQPLPFRRDSMHADQYADERRPRSSDAKSDSHALGLDDRMRSHHSAEPGEITTKSERDSYSTREWTDRDGKPFASSRETGGRGLSKESSPRPSEAPDSRIEEPKDGSTRRRWRPGVPVVRFALPPKTAATNQDSESDDDEDMADYFNMEIEKTEVELSKLQAPSLPHEVMARFARLSHGSMVKILTDSEGFTKMLGIPEGVELPSESINDKAVIQDRMEVERPTTAASTNTANEEDKATEVVANNQEKLEANGPEPQPKTEDMDVDGENAQALPTPGSSLLVGPQSDEQSTGQTIPLAAEEVVRNGLPAAGENTTAHRPPSILLETTEGGSKPPSTPSQVADEEDDDETESEDEAYINLETVRQYMSTPPVEDLPDFSGKAWDKDAEFLESLQADSVVDDFITDHLINFHGGNTIEQKGDRKVYRDNYLRYLKFTMSSDPAAIKSRDKFAVSIPPLEPLPVPIPEPPKPEGRGTGRRYATERDLERVLQASMREEEERRERELRAQKEKYRSDKEAVIPDMYWGEEAKQEARYIDRTGFMPLNRLVSAWHVLPPVDNFTEVESNLLEKRYLELPKQWGKIAEVIPKRDFGTCIQYYYLMKKNLNLKEKLKRQPKRRKKGGRKGKSNTLVSELGNGDPETEENPETGENGERKRPRRAAAPTWGFEQPPIDPDNPGSANVMGRRGAFGSGRGDQPEKVDGRKGGRRKVAKDKDAKLPKPNHTLAAAPPGGKGRSRSGSRVQNPEFQTGMQPEMHRMPTQMEQHMHSGMQPPFNVQQQPLMQSQERPQPLPTLSINEVMAAPSLRPEPPPPLPAPKPAMATFNLAQSQQERKPPTQASSYWSVSESNDFPQLLKSFGSDWTAIAAHMGSKTAVMVSITAQIGLSLSLTVSTGQELFRPTEGPREDGVGDAYSGGGCQALKRGEAARTTATHDRWPRQKI